MPRPNLSNEETQELEKLITEYEEVYVTENRAYGCICRVYRRIDNEDARTVQPPRRLPLEKPAKWVKCLRTCNNVGLSRNLTAPWFSSVVLVRKKREPWFLRGLQKVDATQKDRFPLARIDDTLDKRAGAKWFSTLYRRSSYWQVAWPCLSSPATILR